MPAEKGIRISHKHGQNTIHPKPPEEVIENEMENEIEIENIGPIEELTIVAKPGTITVLTGPNGAGKTQALQAVDGLVTGKSRLGNRDGTTGGTVQGFGVRIKVGRGGANRRSGELEIESVEDRLNIADLVDPGLKDPIAADARRIKRLVMYAGVNTDPSLFYDLAGGKEQFQELVKPASIDKDNIVSLAAAVKRDFEAASRKEADVAENLERDIRARGEANEGIDIEAPHDADALQADLEQAITELATEKQRSAAAREAIETASAARMRIEESKSEYDGTTASFAEVALEIITIEVSTQQQHIDEIRLKLSKATELLETIKHRRDLSYSTLRRAQEYEKLIFKWETDVRAVEDVEPPDPEITKTLAAQVETSREAIETGVRVRDALVRRREAGVLDDRKTIANRNSERLRDAAHGTEDILSRLVAEMGGPFTVDKEFRLIVQHPKRGATYFSELSHGERWKLGLDVAIEAFRRENRPGLLSIQQAAWEGLDADNRRLIANHIKDTDLAILTAEASRQEGADSEVGVKTFE